MKKLRKICEQNKRKGEIWFQKFQIKEKESNFYYNTPKTSPTIQLASNFPS